MKRVFLLALAIVLGEQRGEERRREIFVKFIRRRGRETGASHPPHSYEHETFFEGWRRLDDHRGIDANDAATRRGRRGGRAVARFSVAAGGREGREGPRSSAAGRRRAAA